MNSKVKQANYDVVVVGAGNAGLVAALAAREAGAKVVVLEVAPQTSRGGSTYFGSKGNNSTVGFYPQSNISRVHRLFCLAEADMRILLNA